MKDLVVKGLIDTTYKSYEEVVQTKINLKIIDMSDSERDGFDRRLKLRGFAKRTQPKKKKKEKSNFISIPAQIRVSKRGRIIKPSLL